MSRVRAPRRREDHQTLLDNLWTELRALATAIDGVDQFVAHQLGLNRTDVRGIDVIDQAGALSLKELAERLGLSTSAVTTVIDRLEKAGYAFRTTAAEDRRRTIVQVTPLTVRRTMEMFGGLMAATMDDAERYTDPELAAIVDFVARHRMAIVRELNLSLASTSTQVSRH